MTATAIESGVGHVWQTKQTTLGTIQPANDAGTKHLRIVGDKALKGAKEHGSEEWVDGLAWGTPGVYVNTSGGEVGELAFQVQPETGGFIFAQAIGSDVVTGSGDPYTHTIATGTTTATSNPAAYQTIRQQVGNAVGPWKNAFYDARINKLTFNCGADQIIARVTEGILAMKSAEWFTTSPTAADSGTDPFNWHEATGAVTIDATVFNEVDGETLELDRKDTLHYGDSHLPVCFIAGKGEITRTFSALVTDNTLPVLKTALYGTTSPSNGTALASTVQYVALESTYTRSADRTLKITTPKVELKAADFEIGPRAEGGKIPVAFGGRCLKSGSTSALTVVAKTGDSAAYV